MSCGLSETRRTRTVRTFAGGGTETRWTKPRSGAKSAGIRLSFLHDEKELPVKAYLNALSKILNNLFGKAPADQVG